MKKFIRPKGHDKCMTSTHIGDLLSFGTGKLDGNGFWEHPCEECARAHEQQFPEDGFCWPHTHSQLMVMGFDSVMPLREAVALATVLHSGQERKGLPVPYIIHPIEVVKQLYRWGVTDEAILSAAALHDVLEDCQPLTVRDLACATGKKVAGIVQELTYVKGSMPKQAYLQRFAFASVEALLIKLADRYCNVQDYMLMSTAQAKRYFTEATPLFVAFDGRSGFPNLYHGVVTAIDADLFKLRHVLFGV